MFAHDVRGKWDARRAGVHGSLAAVVDDGDLAPVGKVIASDERRERTVGGQPAPQQCQALRPEIDVRNDCVATAPEPGSTQGTMDPTQG